MASFSGTGSVQSCYKLVLNVEQSTQSITNNNTEVNWNIQIVNSSSSYYFSLYTSTINAIINGVTVYSNTAQRSVGKSATVTIASGTLTIPHNADGTKAITCSCSYSESWPDSYTAGNMSCSGSLTLTTIPRASTFSLSNSDFTMGDSIRITISRASSSFTHKVLLAFGKYSATLSSDAATSYTWKTENEVANLASQIPKSVAGVGEIKVETYNGSTLIGTSSKAFTATIASSVVPICGEISVAETNSTVASLEVGYVKGQSKLLISIGDSKGIDGSTITGYKITANNQTFTTQKATTDALSSSGELIIIATVTDSRGRTASKTMNITVVNYSSPSVNATVTRKASATSTMVVSITGTITSLSSKNIANYTIKSKLKASTDYSSKASNQPMTGTTINITKEVVTYVVGSSYDVQVIVTDKLTSTMITLTLPTDAVILDVNKNGVGIGKYRENGVLDVKAGVTDVYLNGINLLNIFYPVGTIYQSVNSTSPATLFGGTWVQLQNRFLLGAGKSYTNGATGGSATHTLTTNETPRHTHTFTGNSTGSAGSHNHATYLNWDGTFPVVGYPGWNGPASSSYRIIMNQSSGAGYQFGTNATGEHTHTISGSNASTGSGGSHNNMPPYLVVYMWKRTV